MSHVCPQCRAVYAKGETCQDRFDISQLAELAQPDKYAVHHLSVPCYMLQHNVYSREGWLAVRALLGQFIFGGWTPAMARRQGRVSADSGRRTWSFTKGAKLPGVEQLLWSRTIADVRLETAALYCADVRRWAESILADSEELIRAFNQTAKP